MQDSKIPRARSIREELPLSSWVRLPVRAAAKRNLNYLKDSWPWCYEVQLGDFPSVIVDLDYTQVSVVLTSTEASSNTKD